MFIDVLLAAKIVHALNISVLDENVNVASWEKCRAHERIRGEVFDGAVSVCITFNNLVHETIQINELRGAFWQQPAYDLGP